MTLAHPWLALGVLLGAVPVILHLAVRRRYRVVRWAATDILAKALESQAPRVRRADRLLLATRALILVAAALTLARPMMTLPGPPAWAGLAPPAAVVIVDRSGSMQTGAGRRTQIAAARDRARELLAALPAGTRVGLIGMDDRAGPLTAGLGAERENLLAAVDRLTTTARSTELQPALSLAMRWLKDLIAPRKTIYLITDAQESLFTQDAAATRAVLARALPDVRLVVLPVEPIEGPNASITDVEVVTPSSPTGAPATIRVKLAGAATRDTPVGVDLWIDGRKADHRVVKTEHGVAVCLFQPVAAEPGPHLAEARLDPDAGKLDNRRYAAWYTPAAMDALIATHAQDNSKQPSAYVYLQAAIEALAETGLPWVVRPEVRPEELTRALDERVWLLILADCGPLPAEAVGDIARFVERGGSCWLSGGRGLDETLASLQAEASSAETWLSVLRLGPPDTRPSLPDKTSITLPGFGPQAPGPGPIDASADGVLAALTAVNLLGVRPIEPATDSPWSVALRTTAGRALLLTHANHRLAILTTSLNPGTSDWPYRPAFVCLVDDLARWLCRPRLVAQTVPPGFRWQEPPATPAGRYALITPAGQRVLPTVPADCVLEEPGIYRWQAGPALPDARWALAVNVDPAECRGPAWSPAQIAAWLPPGGHCVVSPEMALQRSSAGPRTDVELWPALAAFLLALLAAETVLAHWFTPKPTAVRRSGVANMSILQTLAVTLPGFALPAETSAEQVVGRQWCLRPIVPVPAWLVLGAAAVALAWIVYRSRRVQILRPYRTTLTVLRSLLLLVAASILLQPTVRLQIERSRLRPLALLLDRSGSMATRDGGSGTTSRWRRAIATLQACGDRIDRSLTRAFCFNDQCREIRWNDVIAAGEPARTARTSIGNALRQVRPTLADRPDTEVILISDGTASGPGDGTELMAAARELKRAGLRVHTVLAGNEHLPVFSFEFQEPGLCAFVGEPVRVPIRVKRRGPAEPAIEVSIREGDRLLTSRRIQLPADGDDVLDWFDLRFDQPGSRHCQFRIDGHSRPAAIIGSRDFDVRVTDQPLRVLYVERWPRWSFRFLGNAFLRDRRFAAKCVLLGSSEEPATLPAGAPEWSGIDVVILGDVAPQDLSDAQWQALRAHVVQDGAGLVLAAGPACLPADYLNSPLADLLPFSRMTSETSTNQQPWPLTPTPLGRQHPVLQLQPAGQTGDVWGRLPPLYWCAPIESLKSGAEVLAEKPATAEEPACPVVVAQRVGRGSVLFVGTDETWRWRYELGQTYFYRFWAQAAMFVGLPHRTQSLAAAVPASSRAAEPVDVEQTDVRVGPEVLRQIARETGGKYVALSDLAALIEELGRQALRDRYQKEVSCWDRWPTLAIFAALICAEWLLRKKCHLP